MACRFMFHEPLYFQTVKIQQKIKFLQYLCFQATDLK